MWLASLLLGTLVITTVHTQISTTFGTDDPAFCCNNRPSRAVVNLPTIIPDLVNESPNYIHITPPTSYAKFLDSECITNFAIDNYTCISFIGQTYIDGSYTISRFIVSALLNYPGKFRVQGLPQTRGSSSVVYNEQFLGSLDRRLRVQYRDFLAGRCDILGNSTQIGGDFVFAYSSARDLSGNYIGQVSALASSKNLRPNNLIKLPERLNRHCVTQLNGVSCVNADRVLPQDSVKFPDTNTGTSCQTYFYK